MSGMQCLTGDVVCWTVERVGALLMSQYSCFKSSTETNVHQMFRPPRPNSLGD